MSVSVQVPSLGESVTEAIIASWTKKPGDYIEAEEILVELETDKVSVEIPSPVSGIVTELRAEIDATVNVGDVIAIIEAKERSAKPADEPAPRDGGEEKADAKKSEEAARAAAASKSEDEVLSPAVQRLVEEHGVDTRKVTGTGPGGRILKGDILEHVQQRGESKPAAPAPSKPAAEKPAVTQSKPAAAQSSADQGAREERVRMTKLRQTIARRLVEAQHNAAMLTTFNEIDMSQLMALRKNYQDAFVKRHGTKLGFMSVFTKAVIEGLKAYPAVNAEIDGDDVIYKNYYNIGVAIGGGRGLVVPVIRDADRMSFAEIELEIKRLSELAMKNKLNLDDLQGGTFSITNGGIYGSMLSTPILNPPQSGILGMHNIVDRPVAIDGRVEIRPIMYVALSYDHRIVDGREAVSFLVRVKECVENPERILFEV